MRLGRAQGSQVICLLVVRLDNQLKFSVEVLLRGIDGVGQLVGLPGQIVETCHAVVGGFGIRGAAAGETEEGDARQHCDKQPVDN